MNSANEGRLSGARRAAVLMVLLGEEAAAPIYRTLSERAVQMITSELAMLTNVSAEMAEGVFHRDGLTGIIVNARREVPKRVNLRDGTIVAVVDRRV